MEYNAFTGAGLAAGSTVAQVFATDLDSMDDPAGQIEYTIISGNQLGVGGSAHYLRTSTR